MLTHHQRRAAAHTSRCLIHQLIASMHMNIHDVHAEALNFVTWWRINAINQWIKQREETNASKLERQVLDRHKFLRRHDFQAKKFGRQCTKFGSHAVSLNKTQAKNDTMQNNTSAYVWRTCIELRPERPKIEAAGRVEAQRAENGGRRPIIWQRSSGQDVRDLFAC